MTLLLALFACSEPVAPPAQVVVPAAPAPAEETVYVRASKLNLRAEPASDARKLGSLAINSPLVVLERREGFVRVRVGNGKEGWVGSDFVGGAPLTDEEARDRAAAASDPKERLSWAQRAAAIDVRDRENLTLLAEAYRAVGDADSAARVEAQLAWPADVLLAGDHGPGVVIEYIVAGEPLVERERKWEDATLTPDELERFGLAIGQAWWVLPERGAAVEGRVTGARGVVINECGGTWGILVDLDAALPEGERAIAYTRSEPPASWRKAGPAADVGAERVRERVLEAARGLGLEAPEVHLARMGDGWTARAAQKVPSEYEGEGMDEWRIVDFRLGDGTIEQTGDERTMSYIGYEHPVLSRDIDGDGRLDVLWGGACMFAAYDADGVLRAQTAGTCCGC